MATNVELGGQTVERMRVDLTEKEPIHISVARHARRTTSHYDMHFALEAGIVLRGCMRRYYRGCQRDLEPGQVWLAGVWEPHGFRVLRAPCEAIVIVLWPPVLATLRFEEAPHTNWLALFTAPPSLRPAVAPAHRALVRELGRRMAQLSAGRHAAIWSRLLLLELLLLVHEDATGKPRPAAGPALWEQYRRIDRALELVFNGKGFVSAQSAAAACGVSRNVFSQTFEKLMGLSFAKFALRYRLSGAAAQLRNSSAPLKELAAQWGFADAAHFHRCFVQHYGCAPSAYRRRGG